MTDTATPPELHQPLELESSTFDGMAVLLCPTCGGGHVHIDTVSMLGRPRENGVTRPATVDSHGRVTNGPTVEVPTGPLNPARHVAAISGWCETCACTFDVTFTQHKGRTLVAAEARS
jgi:hypothetical protein